MQRALASPVHEAFECDKQGTISLGVVFFCKPELVGSCDGEELGCLPSGRVVERGLHTDDAAGNHRLRDKRTARVVVLKYGAHP